VDRFGKIICFPRAVICSDTRMYRGFLDRDLFGRSFFSKGNRQPSASVSKDGTSEALMPATIEDDDTGQILWAW
jgi:hypothetical protein